MSQPATSLDTQQLLDQFRQLGATRPQADVFGRPVQPILAPARPTTSFIDNVKALAFKVWEYIKNNWAILAIGAAALVVTTLILPAWGLIVLGVLGFGVVGFALGFGLSHLDLIGGDQSYWDRFQQLDTTSRTLIGVAMGILFPLAPIVGGFVAGNYALHHLND